LHMGGLRQRVAQQGFKRFALAGDAFLQGA
jgi:hypothetical protein